MDEAACPDHRWALIEEYTDPANARSPVCGGPGAGGCRRQPWDLRCGRCRILAWHGVAGSGNLATARALFDDGAELTRQTGLSWSRCRATVCVKDNVWSATYVGAWDECERLAAAGPELLMTLTRCKAGRGRTAGVDSPRAARLLPSGCAKLVAFAGADPVPRQGPRRLGGRVGHLAG